MSAISDFIKLYDDMPDGAWNPATPARAELEELQRRDKALVAIVESWNAYQVTMDDTLSNDNKLHWYSFLEAMRNALKIVKGGTVSE